MWSDRWALNEFSFSTHVYKNRAARSSFTDLIHQSTESWRFKSWPVTAAQTTVDWEILKLIASSDATSGPLSDDTSSSESWFFRRPKSLVDQRDKKRAPKSDLANTNPSTLSDRPRRRLENGDRVETKPKRPPLSQLRKEMHLVTICCGSRGSAFPSAQRQKERRNEALNRVQASLTMTAIRCLCKPTFKIASSLLRHPFKGWSSRGVAYYLPISTLSHTSFKGEELRGAIQSRCIL